MPTRICFDDAGIHGKAFALDPIVALFARLPDGLTTTLAGLALLGTLVSSLATSVMEEKSREASVITFLVTVSGMSFLGLGSALWGLVAGILFSFILSRSTSPKPKPAAEQPSTTR